MARFKWFMPCGEYAAFGIDCEGEAVLCGNRGGWHLAGVTGPDLPTLGEQIARENRAFWATPDRTSASPQPPRRRGLRGGR